MSGSFGPTASNLSSPSPIGNITPNTVNATDLTNSARIFSIPSSAQTLVATSSIACTSSLVPITSGSTITLSSNPQIAVGLNGQKITLVNTGSFAITLVTGNGLLMPSNIILTSNRQSSFTYLTAYNSWVSDFLVPESISLPGFPLTTTPSASSNNNQIANTAFVQGNLAPVWTGFTFQNSFVDSGTPLQTCRHSKVRGLVILQGSATRAISGFTSGMTITNLPVGSRPVSTLRYPSDNFFGPSTLIDVEPNGNINLLMQTTPSPGFILPNFNHIIFPAI